MSTEQNRTGASAALTDAWEEAGDLDLNHPEGVHALWMRVQRLTTDPTPHETYEEWAAANNSRCAEVLKPGHVQIKVDDLDLSGWVNRDEACTPYGRLGKLAIRAAKAAAAQTSPGVELPVDDVELKTTTTPAEVLDVVANVSGRPYSLVAGGVRVMDDDKHRPEADVLDEPAQLEVVETAQPDEPGLGSIVTVNGEHYVHIERVAKHAPFHWLRLDDCMCLTWGELCDLGRAYLGWDD